MDAIFVWRQRTKRMRKNGGVIPFVTIGSVLLLGGVLTWSYFKSQPTNVPPPPPPDPPLVIPVQSTGRPEDLYA